MSKAIISYLRTQKQLCGNTFLIAVELAHRANDQGEAEASYGSLALTSHASQRTCIRQIKQLCDMGIIRKIVRRISPTRCLVNLYQFMLPCGDPARLFSVKVSPSFPFRQGEKKKESLQDVKKAHAIGMQYWTAGSLLARWSMEGVTMAIDPSILFRAQPYSPPAFDFGRPLVLAEELARARQQREAQAFGLGQAQEQAKRQRTWRGAAAELALGQPQQPQSPDFVPQLDANGQQVLQSYVGMDPGSGVGPRGQQALLKRLETTMRLQQEALQDGTQGGYERVRTKAAEELDVPTANSMPDTFDAAQVQRRYEQTRQVYDQLQARQSSQTPRPASEARRRLYEADPVAAQQYETSLREGSRKEILAQAETVGQLLQGVTDDTGYQEVLQTLDRIAPGHGLPRTYDKARVDQAKAQALSPKETLQLGTEALKASTAAGRLSFDVGQAQRKVDYGYGNDVDTALDALHGGEIRQAGGITAVAPARLQTMVAEARQAVEQGRMRVSGAQGREAAEIERIHKPLEGEAAKAVSDLTALRTLTDDIATLRKDAYTGPIVGRVGRAREISGSMDQQEVAFRRVVQDTQDILARLRSGAALPASELQRLDRLAPSLNDPPNVFQAKLQNFQRTLETLREARLRTATTGREQLRQETRPTTPLPGSADVPGMSTTELQAEANRLRAKARQ